MQKPLIYFADGRIEETMPANGKFFTLAEMQDIVRIKGIGHMVEIVPLPSGREMVINEEGKLTDDPLVNPNATDLWKQEYPIALYPENNDELVVGNALVCDPSFLNDSEEE